MERSAGLAWATAAQAYPDKPITLVVPFAAGGPTDKVARDFAEAMRKPLNGATIVVENVGGAGGTLGANKVAKAAPDGYTLLLYHIGMATSPALYRNMPYKTSQSRLYAGHEPRSVPVFSITVEGADIELTVFDSRDLRAPVRATAEGRVIERARLAAVAALLG